MPTLHVTDEPVNERPVSRRSPERKISENTTVEKNPVKSVDSKQLHNVITTKAEARFRQQSSNPNRNVLKTREKNLGTESNVRKLMLGKTPVQEHIVQRTTPSASFIGGSQNPMHMSKVCLY